LLASPRRSTHRFGSEGGAIDLVQAGHCERRSLVFGSRAAAVREQVSEEGGGKCLWFAFAKSGDPNGPAWSRHDVSADRQLHSANEGMVGANSLQPRLDLVPKMREQPH